MPVNELRETLKKLKEEAQQKIQEKETIISALKFSLAGEWYAVDLNYVKEISKLSEITPVPCTPAHLLGIINLRGSIISVIDLKKFFALPDSPFTEEGRLIVVESGHIITSLWANSVSGIIELSSKNLNPAVSSLGKIKAEFIQGEAMVNGKLVVLLNFENILNSREMIGSS